jgi:hypothetical protein
LPIIVTEAMYCANSEPAIRPRIIILTFFLIVLSVNSAWAQDSAAVGENLAEAEVFTPFVSRLETEVIGTQIRLSWTDIPELENVRYNIYRAGVEITGDSFDQARLRGTVESGVETFTDSIPQNGPYYYAVITVDQDNIELPIFIPFRNTNVLAAVVSDIPEGFAVSGISGITAEAGESAIDVRFQTSGDIERLLLYRSTSPITDSDSLSRAIVLDTLDAGERVYRDFVIPGIPYFYAILDADEAVSAAPDLVSGQNSLSEAVELPLGRRYAGVAAGPRNIESLPILVLNQSVLSGNSLPRVSVEIPERRSLSPETSGLVDRLLEPIELPAEGRALPDILATERNPGAEKDQSLVLYSIVSESFSLENYELSQRQLENFLTIPLSEDLENRARYYYAQSLFFTGAYERGFLQFVLIRDWDYDRVSGWMDEILDRLSERE